MKRQLASVLLAIGIGCAQKDREIALPDSSPPLIPEPACAGGEGTLNGRQMGTLRVGMPVDSALALCPSARDTIAFDEGEPVRVLVATMRGDTIHVRILRNTIHSIVVETPLFATADSLKVGVPLGRLLSLPELGGGFGEGEFYVWSNHESQCGMSFRLDDSTARAQIGAGPVTPESLAPYAASGRVSAILIRGC